MAASSETSKISSHVAIRKLATADVPAVLAILQESPEASPWSRESLLRLASNDPTAWVAIVTGAGSTFSPPETNAGSTFTPNALSEVWSQPRITMAGFLIGQIAADEFEILNMAISRTHRRTGIGSKLLESALESSRNAACTRAFLEVRASNAPAIALYALHGFTECGRRPNFYPTPAEDALLLSLCLDRMP